MSDLFLGNELLLCTEVPFISWHVCMIHCLNFSSGSGLAPQSHVLWVPAGASPGGPLCSAQLLVWGPPSSPALHPPQCELLAEGGQ